MAVPLAAQLDVSVAQQVDVRLVVVRPGGGQADPGRGPQAGMGRAPRVAPGHPQHHRHSVRWHHQRSHTGHQGWHQQQQQQQQPAQQQEERGSALKPAPVRSQAASHPSRRAHCEPRLWGPGPAPGVRRRTPVTCCCSSGGGSSASAAAQAPDAQSTGAHSPAAPFQLLHAPSSWPNAGPSIGEGHHEYLPFHSPFRMIMGTAPLPPSEWVQLDPFYPEEMALRQHILQQRRGQVLADMTPLFPGVGDAKRELLDLLIDHLPERFPHVFTREGSVISNAVTGETFDSATDPRDPLELSAMLVQEDLCLMMADPVQGGEYVFVAGAVLFPNGWDLREKLGKTTAHIHAPVPLYQEKVSRRVDAFMRKLAVGKPFWRANWSITADPTLFRPLTEHEYVDKAVAMSGAPKRQQLQQEIPLAEAGERLFTRSERETFVRFPRSQAILFTIRTFVKPLSVFRGRPQLAQACIQALDDLPEDIQQYKMLGPVKGIAREYLLRCARGAC